MAADVDFWIQNADFCLTGENEHYGNSVNMWFLSRHQDFWIASVRIKEFLLCIPVCEITIAISTSTLPVCPSAWYPVHKISYIIYKHEKKKEINTLRLQYSYSCPMIDLNFNSHSSVPQYLLNHLFISTFLLNHFVQRIVLGVGPSNLECVIYQLFHKNCHLNHFMSIVYSQVFNN